MASLTIVVDGAEQRFPLETSAVTLGRGLESDIRLKDIKASRRHCQIIKSPKGYQCVDLSSGNGTYVNGIQIKSQILASGDKITIGSTTIAFDEPKAAPARPAAGKAPTGKLPVAASSPKPPPPRAPASQAVAAVDVAAAEERSAAGPPVSAKTATAKIPTERDQVAPTRKSTVKADAIKSPSQGGLRPATQPLGKSGSRVGKSTGRASGVRPARSSGDAPRKKSPVLFIAIAVVAVLLAAGGYFLFGQKDNGDQVKAQIEQLMKKGEDAEKAEKFEAAEKEYTKALALCQGDRYKVRASEIRTLLAQIETRRSGTGMPPKPDPGPKDPPEKGPDFEAKRTEIAGKFKLSADPSAADWGGAIKEWSDFAKAKPSADTKSKTEAEIRALQAKAKQDLDRLRKKAEALAQENKMAEALDLLKQQKPRFEHTELQAELETAIRQYDK